MEFHTSMMSSHCNSFGCISPVVNEIESQFFLMKSSPRNSLQNCTRTSDIIMCFRECQWRHCEYLKTELIMLLISEQVVILYFSKYNRFLSIVELLSALLEFSKYYNKFE